MCCVAYRGKLYVFGGECERVNKKAGRGKKELNKQTLWSVSRVVSDGQFRLC